MDHLIALLLTSAGAALLIVWPATGPSAFVRERIMRPLIPAFARGVLDCLVCFSVWTGLATAAVFYEFSGIYYCWFSPLMTPMIFWLVSRFEPHANPTPTTDDTGGAATSTEGSETEGSRHETVMSDWLRGRLAVRPDADCKDCGRSGV